MGRLSLQRDTFALLLCDLELECQAKRLPSPEVGFMGGCHMQHACLLLIKLMLPVPAVSMLYH